MSFETPPKACVDESGPCHEARLEREVRRVLRRLSEPGSFLAVASDMDKAIVMRDRARTGRGAAGPDGLQGDGEAETIRTAVVERDVAQTLALKDWISCSRPGRIARYRITAAGRAAVGRMLAQAENAAHGFADARKPFVAVADGSGRARPRVALAESPLATLARRRDRDGQPFLSNDLVAAGERLREDFELAQMGPRTGQNWEGFLTGAVDGSHGPGEFLGGSKAARDRVAQALRDLGPGLGDAALRCCCYLEGLEKTEQRMGWSARSGKIVLRIALQRLKRHYEGLGEGAGLIG